MQVERREPLRHVAHLFDHEDTIADVIADFFETGFEQGAPAIMIATPGRQRAVCRRLAQNGLDLDEATRTRRITLLDARSSSDRFMRDGLPDPGLFASWAQSTLADHTGVGSARPRLYGEIVDLLRKDGNPEAVLRLERLWNALAHEREFALLCGYDCTGNQLTPDAFARLCCGEHSLVIHPDATVTASGERAADELDRAQLERRVKALGISRAQRSRAAQAMRQLIAECRHAEEALTASRRRLAELCEGDALELAVDASAPPPERAPLDWLSLARLLAARTAHPLLVLDRTGSIRAWSRGFEQAFGFERNELEGRAWADVGFAPAARALVLRTLNRAWLGTLHGCELEVLARDGRRLSIAVDAELVGRGREQGLLLTIHDVRPAQGSQQTKPEHDYDYEIVSAVTRFGALKSISGIGSATQSLGDRDYRCFQFLHGRSSPCPDCPVLSAPGDAAQRTVIRASHAQPDRFEVLSVSAVDASSSRVSVRALDEQAFAAMRDARVRQLAQRFRLSDRERDVLAALLTGKSLDDIAESLQISVRTVKFHQANLLDKVGADSRADLLRLL